MYVLGLKSSLANHQNLKLQPIISLGTTELSIEHALKQLQKTRWIEITRPQRHIFSTHPFVYIISISFRCSFIVLLRIICLPCAYQPARTIFFKVNKTYINFSFS